MRKEIDKAVETFHRIAFGTKKRSSQTISDHQLSSFVTVLTELLVARYKNNWYPQNPVRGSGYRCLRMNSQCVDPTICESLAKSDIELTSAQRAMELTVWVDPGIVSIRIGEEGSIGMEKVGVDLPFEEDEAYASRSPSPVRPQPTHLITPPKDIAIQHGASSINQQARMVPGAANAIYPRQHASPPTSMPAQYPSPRATATVHAMTNSQEYLQPSSYIPTSHSSYSRPKALFPSNQDNFQGYYPDGMVAAQNRPAAALPMRIPRNMMRKGNYMEIPAQA